MFRIKCYIMLSGYAVTILILQTSSLAVGTADLFFKKATLNSWLKLTDLLAGGNLNKRSVGFLGRYTRFFQNVDILVKK